MPQKVILNNDGNLSLLLDKRQNLRDTCVSYLSLVYPWLSLLNSLDSALNLRVVRPRNLLAVAVQFSKDAYVRLVA